MITYKLAEQIVTQTMLRLHYNINVMNLDGTILASGDKNRIDHIHAATKEIIKTKKPVYIDEHNIHLYPNALPGINLPIFFQNEIVCIIGITGEPSSIEEISKLVQLTAEVIVNQALIQSQSEWQQKMSAHIFSELIEGAEIKGVLKERIEKLPFSLQPPYAVSIIRAKHKTASHRTLIQYLEDFFYMQPVLYGHFQLDEYYILSTQADEMAIEKMIHSLYSYLKKRFDIQVGVGRLVEKLSELPKSYSSAMIAVNEASSEKDVTFYKDIQIKALFHKEDANRYSDELLRSLDNKLIMTLRALFEHNLQLNATAEALNIHRHTLTYRIEKIRALSGLNPLQLQDAFKLHIALLFK